MVSCSLGGIVVGRLKIAVYHFMEEKRLGFFILGFGFFGGLEIGGKECWSGNSGFWFSRKELEIPSFFLSFLPKKGSPICRR
jgi:hypothetical protein